MRLSLQYKSLTIVLPYFPKLNLAIYHDKVLQYFLYSH
ncbi:hypothetical protein WZ342_2571 [Enterococcus faecalis]|nr:hypothetical protein WZ342_2571 [Enterococcus faecalis]